MSYSLIVDDNFTRSNTSVGSGANSTTGVGNGWVDFVGNLWNISSNLLNGTSVGTSPAKQALYRQVSENYQNGKVLAWAGAGGNNDAIGLIARFDPSGGGNGYAALIYTDNLFFVYKVVAGTQTALLNSFAFTPKLPVANFVAEMVVTSLDANTAQITLNVYDPTNLAQPLNTKTITDATTALQATGAWGVSGYSGPIKISRAQTYSASGLTPGAATVTQIKTRYNGGPSVALVAAAPVANTGSVTYQWYRSTTNGFTPAAGNAIGGATALTYTDSGVSAGTTYYYVQAQTDSLTTVYTNQIPVKCAGLSSPAIGAIGDSITMGFGVSPSPVATMQTAMITAGVPTTTYNGGVSGQAVSDWTSGINLTNFLAACAFRGIDTASIMLGTNDANTSHGSSANTFATNLATLITALLVNTTGIGRIFVHYPPYVQLPASGWDAASDPLLLAYQAKIDAAVNGTTVYQGDTTAYSNFLANQASYGPPSPHPNQAGANYLGGAWATALMVTIRPTPPAGGDGGADPGINISISISL